MIRRLRLITLLAITAAPFAWNAMAQTQPQAQPPAPPPSTLTEIHVGTVSNEALNKRIHSPMIVGGGRNKNPIADADARASIFPVMQVAAPSER